MQGESTSKRCPEIDALGQPCVGPVDRTHVHRDEWGGWALAKNGGRKDDAEKPRYDLVPALALDEIVVVLTHGAAKYGDFNWREVPHLRRRYFAAAMRHIWTWWRGERNDPDTDRHHLAHAACCVLFLLEVDLRP